VLPLASVGGRTKHRDELKVDEVGGVVLRVVDSHVPGGVDGRRRGDESSEGDNRLHLYKITCNTRGTIDQKCQDGASDKVRVRRGGRAIDMVVVGGDSHPVLCAWQRGQVIRLSGGGGGEGVP
jgi:hypothetical protein